MFLSVQLEAGDSPRQIRAASAALATYADNLEDRQCGEAGTASSTGGPGITAPAGPADVAPAPKRTRKSAQAVAPDPEPEPEPEPDQDLPADEEEEEEDTPPPAQAKTNGKANGKANGKGDDEALRQEILERFAAYADEAGVLEGKALLKEFKAAKFSEIAAADLKGFGKRLSVLEASL